MYKIGDAEWIAKSVASKTKPIYTALTPDIVESFKKFKDAVHNLVKLNTLPKPSPKPAPKPVAHKPAPKPNHKHVAHKPHKPNHKQVCHVKHHHKPECHKPHNKVVFNPLDPFGIHALTTAAIVAAIID